MLKKYQDFINEGWLSRSKIVIYNIYDSLIDIYNNKIVPKIGEVEEYKNHMLDNVLEKEDLKEFNDLKKVFIDSRNDFADYVLGLDKFYGKHFSTIVHSSSDPDEDFEEIQKIINRTGYDLEVIKKLFDPIVCVFLSENFGQFIQKHQLDEQNGYIDIYLYKLNENLNLDTKVWLGGDSWGDALQSLADEEYVVKYAYGYHKTKYGKLFLDQIGLSKEDFVSNALEYIKDHMNREVIPDINSNLLRDYGINFEVTDEYITFDDDRFIINYGDMYKDICKLEPIKDFYLEDLKKIVIRNFKTNTYNIEKLNIQDTGDELIIS